MKTLSEFLKTTIINASIFGTTILAIYASVIFFTILLLDESFACRQNKILREDFEVLIQKLHNAPELLREIFYPNQDNKGINVAKEGF